MKTNLRHGRVRAISGGVHRQRHAQEQLRYKEKHPDRVRDSARRTYEKKAAFLREWKLAHGCADCGYREDHRALQFDHVRGEPLYYVSAPLSWEKLDVEIAKCDVVCANCHSIRTANRREGLE